MWVHLNYMCALKNKCIVISITNSFVLAFEGYYAWRNREKGSWYIEAVVKIFMKFAKCEDVCAMLNRVGHFDLLILEVGNCFSSKLIYVLIHMSIMWIYQAWDFSADRRISAD